MGVVDKKKRSVSVRCPFGTPRRESQPVTGARVATAIPCNALGKHQCRAALCRDLESAMYLAGRHAIYRLKKINESKSMYFTSYISNRTTARAPPRLASSRANGARTVPDRQQPSSCATAASCWQSRLSTCVPTHLPVAVRQALAGVETDGQVALTTPPQSSNPCFCAGVVASFI